MFSKFILYISVVLFSRIFARISRDSTRYEDDPNYLQERFSRLLSRPGKPFNSFSSSGEKEKVIREPDLSYLKSLLFQPSHHQTTPSVNLAPIKSALEIPMKMKTLLREQCDMRSFLQMAQDLRDIPHMKFHMWLKAFLSASYERDELVVLQKPHPLAVTPELFLSREAYELAKAQAQVLPQDRMCIPVDGSLTSKNVNGKEQALWYFREDLFLNNQHGFWHFVHPNYETNPEFSVDRRGEAFYYFHRTFLSRYDTERLAMGFDRVEPLKVQDGYVIEEGYMPPMAKLEGLGAFGNRYHNTVLKGANDLGLHIQNIRNDTEEGYLISRNGSRISLLTPEGIDILVNNMEAYYPGINFERYLEFGIHNTGHVVITGLSEWNGIMDAVAASTRDPIFYRWHKTLDEIFELNKVTLPPYDVRQGEFPLVWEGVEVTSIEVNMIDFPSNPPNILETHMGIQKAEIPHTPDRHGLLGDGSLEYCIKRLEHSDFQYKITMIRKEASKSVNATVRIFMAPRFNEREEEFSLVEQRLLFFPLDRFQVTLNSGEDQIIRQSTESSLTIVPWKPKGSEIEMPRHYCGCGWPDNLLIPRGTAEGMHFDLFVLLTEAPSLETESNDNVCIPATILCGLRQGKKYPDPYPMGYPFDRLPFNDPETHKVVSSINRYTQFIPNSKVTQVIIFHKDLLET